MITFAFLLLAWLLPLRDMPLVVAEPTVRLFDVAAVPAILVAGIALLRHRETLVSPAMALALPLAVAWLLFSASLGLFADGDPYLMARGVVWTIYSGAVFFAASTFAQLLPRRLVLGQLIAALVAANVVAALIFLVEPAWVTRWAGSVSLEGEGVAVQRFPGFASEPNYWGSVLLAVLPLAWALLLSGTTRARAGLSGWAGGLLLIAAALTFSTYTQVGLVAALVLTLAFGLSGRKLGATTTACIVALVALALVFVVEGYGDYLLQKLTTYSRGTNSERFHAWLAALRMWLEAPVFGFGLGAYPTHYLGFADIPLPPIESAHSVVFATLAEQGVAGLVVLVVLFTALLGVAELRVRDAWARDPVVRLLGFGLVLYIGFLLITGNLYLYYFWFYAGLHHGLAIQASRVPVPDRLATAPAAV